MSPILARLPHLQRHLRRLAPPSLLAFAALLTGGCGSSHHKPPNSTPPPHTSPAPPPAPSPARVRLESIFEAGPQLATDPAGALDTLRLLGVDRVKVFIPWRSVAPDPASLTQPAGFDATDPASYPALGWERFDAIVRDAKARGIGVDLSLNSPPVWAAGADAPNRNAHPQWKPSPSKFGAFVQAVAKRYSGSYTPAGSGTPLPRIRFWSIWNEPNYGTDLAPQASHHSTIEISPVLYRGLLDAAWKALHETGHGSDTILIGELAPRGITVGDNPGNFSGMVPLRFLRSLYCVDSSLALLQGAAAAARGCPSTAAGSAAFRTDHPALFEASGFAVHPYPHGGLAPNQALPNEPDYADLPALPKVEQLLDRLQALHGSSTRFPIWSTEYGYQTNPPETVARISPATAAYYINWGEYISWQDQRVASYDQYLLVDPARANSTSGFATGLEFKDGTPKATYAAYRLPLYLPATALQPGQQAEVWGCVRPARFARLDTGALQNVRIQFAPSSGGRFRTVRTVALTHPDCYFDVEQAFGASGAVRLAWTYPHGPTIFSRTVMVTVR